MDGAVRKAGEIGEIPAAARKRLMEAESLGTRLSHPEGGEEREGEAADALPS